MAGRIPQSFIDDLLYRVDIVDVVNSRVQLKKTGKNWSACCPFHNEKSPSFTVAPDKQFYYCFGCGATGNAIKFLMEYDRLDFVPAIEELANQAGMDVPREEQGQASEEQIAKERQRAAMFDVMEQTTAFFEKQLRQSDYKQKAVDYLKNRGLSGKAAKFFAIGYTPPGWDNLLTELATDDAKRRALIDSGMLIEKVSDQGEVKIYDRFRDRVMFPIRDARGRTIGFGGRVLGDEKPKYLNSPETPIFHKGKELYGLYECKKIRQKLTRMLIVEGYMDVVALAEHGVHYAVATLGTATSQDHLQRIFKQVQEVIYCFDGDAAGNQAAVRALDVALPMMDDGRRIRFLFLPNGEDPDSMIRQEGKDAFESRINKAISLPEFLLQHLAEETGVDTLDGKARLAKLAAPKIKTVPGLAVQSLMFNQLEKMTGVSLDKLEQMAEQESKPTYQRAPDPKPAPQPDPVEGMPFNDHPPQGLDEPNLVPEMAPDNPLSLKALTLLMNHPFVAEAVEEFEFLKQFTDRISLLLCRLLTLLKESPQGDAMGLLGGHLTLDPDFLYLKSLVEHNPELHDPRMRQGLAQEFRDYIQALIKQQQAEELQALRVQLEQNPNKELQAKYLELLKAHKGV